MKILTKIKMLILVGLLFNVAIAFSNNNNDGPGAGTKSIDKTAEKTIKDYFKFPSILLPHQGDKVVENRVEVVFTTDHFGKVNFVIAKTEDKILKTEIEKQFYALKLPNLKYDVAHSVVLNFRTL